MLVRLGDAYINSSAIRTISRKGPAAPAGMRYEIEYDDGSVESFVSTVDLDETLMLVPAPQDHTVVIIDDSGRLCEKELIAFQINEAGPLRPPALITTNGRYQLGPAVGLRGPSGRVSIADRVFETLDEFRLFLDRSRTA